MHIVLLCEFQAKLLKVFMNQNFKNNIYSEKEIFDYYQTFLKTEIFAVNKPANWTCQDVISFLKQFLKVKKINCGETLDLLASGLLIIGINQKIKELSNFLNEPKTYKISIELNKNINNVIDQNKNAILNNNKISLDLLNNTINYFNNLEYYQKPHKLSTAKVAGNKIYKYDHDGKSIQIESRKVKIYNLKLISFVFPFLEMKIKVSKGFHLKCFADDFALKLNTTADLKHFVCIECKNFILNDKTLNIIKLKRSLKLIKKY